MWDQMSMPVLFVVVIVVLGLITVGLFLGIRILGARERPGAPTPRRGSSPNRP